MTNQELIEFIDAKLGGYHAKVDAQNTITNLRLSNIDERLKILNGTVAEHDKILKERGITIRDLQNSAETRAATCPHLEEINELKTNNKIGISIKKLIITSITLIGIIIGIAYSSIKINEVLRQKDVKQIVKTELQTQQSPK